MIRKLWKRIVAELLIRILVKARNESLTKMISIEWARYRMRCRAINHALDAAL